VSASRTAPRARYQFALAFLLLAIVSAHDAAAQSLNPGPPGPFVFDARGVVSGIPNSEAFVPPGLTTATIPSRGFGGGVGLSPLPPLGATYATGTHFDYPGVLEFAEILHVQTFMRIQPASWFRLDGGARAGIFLHLKNDIVDGGPFLGLFVAPALAWRWLQIGPRVSGNLIAEDGGEKAANLVIEYVMLRFVKRW